MDLAKIRKKSLQSPEMVEEINLLEPTLPLKTSIIAVETTPSFSRVDVPELSRRDKPSLQVATPVLPVMQFAESLKPERFKNCTPLEAILAGRVAAGCDDEAVLADEDTDRSVSESTLEFLCFRVSDEIYGINIMDIKEIIKPRDVTEVPRAPAFVSGVLSLRGTIIPIIDMRVRLGLSTDEPTGKERIVVIKSNTSLSGLLVDEVIQVVQVRPDAVEAAPIVLDGIDRDFVTGIGRSDGRLMIILNLENISDIHLY